MNEQQTLKIYHIAKRVTPFTPASTEGDFISGTSRIFNDNKIDVRVFLPRYGYISERKFILREVIRLKDIEIDIDGTQYLSCVKSAFIPDSRVQVYFNVFPEFYRDISRQVTSNYMEAKNPNVYKAFLNYAFTALNTLERLYWQPDIILCYNWHTAVVPILIKGLLKNNDWFKKTRVVTVLSRDEPFYAFPDSILKQFHVENEQLRLSRADSLLEQTLLASDGIIMLNSKKEDKLEDLLKHKQIRQILSDKKEHSRIFNINSSTDNNEFWGPIAKELYEFLAML
ncbi:MAG: glycogen/starch synthase [Candidatus Neomarinimicrobiota bacterium]|jgi:starch synthase|nr:glycogen/starch synthase [Candidatus Neomarinimicrobiota bacterium]MDD3966475.1 glycogen/starch synthase [Candidatus Neomarinimicrobiota bacterium]MDX9779475.1 glycogen/starch synthase [bacterium]